MKNFVKSRLILGLGLPASLFLLGLLSFSPSKSLAVQTQGPTEEQVRILGRKLFYDTTLSNPSGLACASCHSPMAGYSYPDEDVNLTTGTVPGAVNGRFTNRKPPSLAYSNYLPSGVPYYVPSLGAYVGGLFFDGRAATTTAQAEQPFLNPNEMNNSSEEAVILKLENGPSNALFKQVWGANVYSGSIDKVYGLIARSIATFEASPEVASFSSKYDAWLQGKATLTSDELQGLRMVTGRINGRLSGVPTKYNAHCEECHGIIADPKIGPDLWTNSCYANIGVPKNPNNPYYGMTDKAANPTGFNPLGKDYVDLGLGDFLYPHMGLPPGDLAENDPLAIDGTFKAPTLRNVDARPWPGFTKSYMHNGVFKNLKQVVHFYNTRNLTTYSGEVIDFTKPDPYAGLKGTPLWPKPEWPSPISMINPQGASNLVETVGSMANEQIGNMGMSDLQENQIVAFLKTLTDGYFDPN